MGASVTSQPIVSVRLEDVEFGYDDQKPVFSGLTLDLPVNKALYLRGETGQGTSTFLKLVAVVNQPHSGAVLINGLNTSQMSFEEFLPLRLKIGYTFDYGGLFANRSLLDNLTLPLLYHKIYGLEEARAIGIEAANHFGFYKKLAEKPASVTGGLRKLTSVLRTLMLNPEMLVMDDPFMGVDPQSCAKLVKILNDRRASGEIRHLILTSRDQNLPRQLGCESLLLHEGNFQISEAA